MRQWLKSFFLEEFDDGDAAKLILSKLLPHHIHPWLLRDDEDGVIAYLEIVNLPEGKSFIQADLSGRHYVEDAKVLQVLKSVQEQVGGTITDDDGNVVL